MGARVEALGAVPGVQEESIMVLDLDELVSEPFNLSPLTSVLSRGLKLEGSHLRWRDEGRKRPDFG